MTEQMAHIVYLIAGVLFIFSLAGLAKQETARSGNLCGIIGMAIAILVAMAMASGLHSLVYAAIALGAVLGAIVASRVAMDKMPELVAILHSFVGLAAVLVGFAQFLKGDNSEGVEHLIHQIETYGHCHWRDHLYRFHHRLGQTFRHSQRQGTHPAGA